MAFATPRYLSPVSTVSATNALDYDPPFGAPTHEKKKKKEKKKKRLHFLSLAAKASETKNCIYIFTTATFGNEDDHQYSDTHADVTYRCSCANQSRIGGMVLERNSLEI